MKSSLFIDELLQIKNDIRDTNMKVYAADPNSNVKWKSNFIIELGFGKKLKMLLTNKAYVYLLCAAFFRFAGGYCLGYWGKSYFSNVYPDRLN